MRALATEPSEAVRRLGVENGRAFIGLVADFRNARFAGDVPGGPLSTYRNETNFEQEWFVSSGCTLRTVIAATGAAEDVWKDAHRIRLVSLLRGTEVLV